MSKKQMLADIARAIGELSATLKSVSGTKKDTALGFGEANAYHWDATSLTLLRVDSVSAVPLSLLRGINDIRATLEQNTLQFARAHSANNALLWGARGMGKSSLVKALHASIAQRSDKDLKRLVLVEINREDIASLPALMRAIAPLPARFIVFCDDLSFDAGEVTYKSLKTILDGGLEGRPANVLFYATSNRRHLMPRDMIDNERSTSINPGEAVDEKISLSDRFGLWLGFHNCSQDEYLEMVAGYSAHYGIQIGADELRSRAIAWAAARGARSGRVAIQFIRQLAGEKGQAI